MKIITSFIKCFFAPLMVLLLTATMTGCSDDKETLQAGDGYVQFKLYKSASYDKTDSRAANNRLDYLNEAKKIQVVLLHNNVTITQSVALSAYNSAEAEYGLSSEKLELVAGEYQLIGYYLFDKVETQILAGEPAEPTKFIVTEGGLVIQDVVVNVVPRGKVNFTLVKEIQHTVTRDANLDEPFENIYRFNIKVKNVETKQVYEFSDIKATYKEDFDKDVMIATATTDTVLYLKAGTYQFTEYHLFAKDSKNQTLGYRNEFPDNQTFTIEDNKETKVNVPTRVGLADYLKDYVALKAIWESLKGQEWSYVGEEYPRGANWSFDDKQMDMWGKQPGVSLDNKGRVTAINIGGFNPKGDLSPLIGDLSELKVLTIGTHNDIIGGGPIEQYGGNITPEQLKIIRNDYYNKFLARDARAGFSEELQYGFKLKGEPIQKKLNRGISLFDVQHGELTNGVESIPEEIGNLTKLQQFYIANSKVTGLPYGMANLVNCTDLEIYNCPMMKKYPAVINQMPKVQLLILSANKQWDADEIYKGVDGLAKGAAQRELQVLYLGNNNLKRLPASFANFIKLGKLDCVNNQIEVIESAFPSTTNITQLTMDYNKIKQIPANENGTFCGYSSTEAFSFSHNELTEVPDLFDAKSIYVMASVNFSNNKITSFQHANNGFKGINAGTIDLSYNQLTEFPAILFSSGSPITTLNLAGNSIEKFAKGSLDGKNAFALRTLDLRFNKLSKLPEDFYATKLPYLYGLDLSYNRFTSFPYEPLDMTTLTVFSFRYQRDADGNRCMREWPTGVYKHVGLRALYLGSNDIRKVDDEQISPTIFNLDISDNPNIIIDLSDICPWISANQFNLYYDKTQDIRGCDILGIK